MIILTLIDVSGRYFGHPLHGTLEINTLCLVVICAWCWAHTQALKGHISIDLFYNLMPSRAQTITNIVTSAIALIIISLLAWQSIPMTLLAMRLLPWTDRLHLPIWPFKAMLILGFFCLCLQLILDIIDYSKELRRQPHGNTA